MSSTLDISKKINSLKMLETCTFTIYYLKDNNKIVTISQKLLSRPFSISYPDIEFIISYHSKKYNVQGYTLTII